MNKMLDHSSIYTYQGMEDKAGDVWTWTALDADSKLIVSWFVGNRDLESAHIFMQDVAGRLANRVQLTTDGHKAYLQAVDEAFGGDIDFAQLVKIYGNSTGENKDIKKPLVETKGLKPKQLLI